MTGLTLAVMSTGAVHAENPRVNVQVFRPSAHVGDLLTTMTSDVGEHLQWGAGLYLHFGKNALVFVDTSGDSEVRHEVVQDQLTADLYGSISLLERLSVGLSVPIFLLNSGESDGFIPLDPEIACLVQGHIKKHGVQVVANDGVIGFKQLDGGAIEVQTSSGKAFPADIVILAIGVKPDTTLAKSAGLALGERGGIEEQQSAVLDEGVDARHEIRPARRARCAAARRVDDAPAIGRRVVEHIPRAIDVGDVVALNLHGHRNAAARVQAFFSGQVFSPMSG